LKVEVIVPSGTRGTFAGPCCSCSVGRVRGAAACASTTLGIAKGYQPPLPDNQCALCQESKGSRCSGTAPHDVMPKRGLRLAV